MQNHFNRGSALIDNATIFSVAQIFQRPYENRCLHRINVIGLASLIEAFIIHNQLIVDEGAWKFLQRFVPDNWLQYLDRVLVPVRIKFPSSDEMISEMITNKDLMFLTYFVETIDHFDIVERIYGSPFFFREFYRTYTGSDVGIWQDEDRLINELEDRIGFHPRDIWLRSGGAMHVSLFQSLVRGLQYEHAAASFDVAYVAHELRGVVLAQIAKVRSHTEYRSKWLSLRKKLESAFEKSEERMSWLGTKELNQLSDFAQIKVPLFLANVLSQAKSIEDIFSYANSLRNKALPVRQLMEQVNYVGVDRIDKRLIKELNQMGRLIGDMDANPATTIGISVGVPLSISISRDIGGLKHSKSCTFIRDLFDNHRIPELVSNDMERVFGDSGLHPSFYYDLKKSKYTDENIFDLMISWAK